jgi:acetolactate synthase I/II/III large subunit
MLDSVPMVCITGQVGTPLMGTDAFQELDVFGMTMPIVKHSFLVRSVDELPRVMAEAFRIAREGRPGPVLVDLPKDVQVSDASHLPDHVPAAVQPPPAPAADAIAEALAAIAGAEKPVIYGGGGIALGNAVEAFRRFVEASGIPTVLTLRGLGALPANHPNYLGMLGMHGTRAANMAVQESDLLIVVGARFDDRATGKLAEFAPFARVMPMPTRSPSCAPPTSRFPAMWPPACRRWAAHAVPAMPGRRAVPAIANVSASATTHRAPTSMPRRC